ncbi:DUF1015 domain-containing protein [Anaerovorax odorimutans]|uniref:DUF1015 domain-containing protein n=1 Tax=Anaerovorax odorimutans TaxID=109327 RepID=UPI000429D289|nr:DUF1015 family protein [Anaerovorax odorimutans]
MAIVKPFRAVRPKKEYAEKVISLPYDVMNRKEASKMAEGNPYSFLHICRSEIDLEDIDDPYTEVVYKKAKSNLNGFLADEVMIRDKKPMLYIYRQTMDGRVQTGIVGCVSVDDYQNNVIKKHEFTRVEKELDRINHFDICNANTEPVFLTYRNDKRIKTIIEGWISKNKPEYDIVSEDGIGHTLWVINDENTIDLLTGLFAELDSFYIADGHHRSASAVKVGMKRREENPNYTGGEEFNFFMSVIFPDEDLKIFDYNRVVKDLNGYTKEEFLNKISEKFTTENYGSKRYVPEVKHSFGMYLDNEWYKITIKPEFVDDKDLIQSLDVSVLQNNLLDPILGIKDPRTDKRIDFVGGIRGLEGLEKRVNEDMNIAFALYPVAISDLLAVSDNDMVMPPKSTWFEPKLGSGLFVHEL